MNVRILHAVHMGGGNVAIITGVLAHSLNPRTRRPWLWANSAAAQTHILRSLCHYTGAGLSMLFRELLVHGLAARKGRLKLTATVYLGFHCDCVEEKIKKSSSFAGTLYAPIHSQLVHRGNHTMWWGHNHDDHITISSWNICGESLFHF